MTEKPERPGPEATSAEIMEWMERDFAWAVAEGAAKAGEQEDGDEEGREDDNSE